MRRAALGILPGLALLLALPSGASAFDSQCSFSAGTVSMIVESGDPATLSVAADGSIQMDGVACSTATRFNTSTVYVGWNGADTQATIDTTRPFAPGTTGEDGVSEIEFRVDANTGGTFNKLLTLAGAGGARAGASATAPGRRTTAPAQAAITAAANLDGDADADIVYSHTDNLAFDTGAGNDVVDVRGGAGTGARAASAASPCARATAPTMCIWRT